MQDKNIILKTLIPHVGHTNLLYIASAVWFFAGGMLLYRGFMGVVIHSEFLLPKVIVALFLGFVFYNLMFRKISKKHINRIKGLKNKRNPFYAVFNLRGYLMMIFMISMGIAVRLLALVPFEYMALFYIVMGTPLLLSAFRFFYNGITFQQNS